MSEIKAIEPWAVQRPRLRVNGMLRMHGEWHPLKAWDRSPVAGARGVVERILVERSSVDYRLPAGEWDLTTIWGLRKDHVAYKAHWHYFSTHGARDPAEVRPGLPVWIGEMRVKDLMYGVMNDIAREQGYRNFDHYHEWYLENVTKKDPGRGVPEGSTEVWPVILSTFADEGLQDGSHRFHQYVEMGLETIPVLAYATELQEIKKIAEEWLHGY